jgi:hypothetical protein
MSFRDGTLTLGSATKYRARSIRPRVPMSKIAFYSRVGSKLYFLVLVFSELAGAADRLKTAVDSFLTDVAA